MQYCKIFSSTFNAEGISVVTEARSVATLDLLHNVSGFVGLTELKVGNTLWFSRISVPAACQSNGEGTFIMNHVCEICDCHGLWIINAPTPYNYSSRKKLLAFYETFNFKPANKLSGLLLRKPMVLV